ncbi:MAG: endonuclease/exonuclease/phosphatase family protein [Actinomycetota bacterium]|nr:endonuclease/exonuclease/phosphatase family protein [Actinomycetota bacterium]
MRVVTFNVLHGRSLSNGEVDAGRFQAEIVGLDADVLGLQEVDRAQPRSSRLDLAALAALAVGEGADYRYVPALMGTPGEPWRAATSGDVERTDEPSYGVALVTRLPVQSWHTVLLKGAPMRSPILLSDSAGGRARVILVRDEPRALVAAVVDGPGGPMTVATTHLSFVPGWNVWQLRKVCRELRRLPAPRILLGDLNIPGAVAGVLSGWRLLARAATYPGAEPQAQLDHVLCDGPVPGVAGSEARAMGISDHRALIVDLK